MSRLQRSTACQVVKRAYSLTDDDLRTKSQRCNEGRDVAIYLARTHSRRTLCEIGDEMGKISPSAVNMAYNRVVRQLFQRPSLRQKVEQMMHQFEAPKELVED